MKLERLEFEQFIPLNLQDAWTYFSSPKNLNEITPDDLSFQILTSDIEQMYLGQIIEYKISPFSGFSLPWVTEITHLKETEFFVDEQRFGPYEFWHHRHQFKSVEGGVLMKDLLHYRLPFGVVGKLVDRLVVKKKVMSIFQHRFSRLENKFGNLRLK